VIRHHRLVETYLVEVLGVDWDKVHDEADRWEHILSKKSRRRWPQR
jgi:DtxR family Mn-dependent transcriptional regulator